MSTALLDVNVLIALLDSAHPFHEESHLWFGQARRKGWATCSTTLCGCIRIISHPGYLSVKASAAEVAERLRILCDQPGHTFWSEDLSPLDEHSFRLDLLSGPRQLTDVYLLALAVRRRGRLVTFDQSIPLSAVPGAELRHLELLPRRR